MTVLTVLVVLLVVMARAAAPPGLLHVRTELHPS
jgi:hypothetical protein